jgi:hypothetical protein
MRCPPTLTWVAYRRHKRSPESDPRVAPRSASRSFGESARHTLIVTPAPSRKQVELLPAGGNLELPLSAKTRGLAPRTMKTTGTRLVRVTSMNGLDPSLGQLFASQC